MSENQSVLNWTFCQLLSEKPNCTKASKEGDITSLKRHTKLRQCKHDLKTSVIFKVFKKDFFGRNADWFCQIMTKMLNSNFYSFFTSKKFAPLLLSRVIKKISFFSD